jgi:hypothetical protein
MTDMDGSLSMSRPGKCFLAHELRGSLSGPGALTFLLREPTPPARRIHAGLISGTSLLP